MSLLRGSLAVAAIVLVAAAAASDFVIGSFWVAHPMVTAIVSALVVVLLSAAVIESVLSRRAEQRWSLLAQRSGTTSSAGWLIPRTAGTWTSC